MEDIPTIIIDNGTHSIKAGYAGDDAPLAVFPSIVAYNEKEPNHLPKVGDWTKFKPELNIVSPIERGVITDFDKMADIWHWTFWGELRRSPQDHPILLTEPTLNPNINREKMMQVMFERFQIPALYIANQAVLARYASGYTTGLVLDSGEGSTTVVPIYYGHALSYAAQRLDLGGADLTNYLQRLRAQRGDNTDDIDVIRDIKERHCYVAFNYEEEMNSVTSNRELFQCPEALFQPSLLGIESCGIHEATVNAVMKCDPELHRDLFLSVALSGGSTLFTGLYDRLQHELRLLVPSEIRVKVVAPPERKYSTWIGASILASLSIFPSLCATRADYDEYGPALVHRKFF